MKKLFFICLCTIVLFSCNKGKTDNTSNACKPYVAPCPNPEKVFASSWLEYGPSTKLPQAKFRLLFSESLNGDDPIEFGFNRYPTTGLFYMVTMLDTLNTYKPSQITYVSDSGSFLARPASSDLPSVYIEANSTEIIISYCDISDGHFQFYQTLSSYVGTSPVSRRIRFNY
jgi:hypothetical protein